MIHRAIFGSLERFIGILLEHYSGNLPLWLAPTQMRLLPVLPAARKYCKQVAAQARLLGLRVEVDNSGERLAGLIRAAELEKLPCVAVVGEKEMSTQSLSIRGRKGVSLGMGSVESILQGLVRYVDSKKDSPLSAAELGCVDTTRKSQDKSITARTKTDRPGNSQAPLPILDSSNDAVITALDIRVGNMINARKHPQADKLYVEDIDIGEDGGPRQICSGSLSPNCCSLGKSSVFGLLS